VGPRAVLDAVVKRKIPSPRKRAYPKLLTHAILLRTNYLPQLLVFRLVICALSLREETTFHTFTKITLYITIFNISEGKEIDNTRMYPKVSRPAAWSHYM
jgi:hypothetical protein